MEITLPNLQPWQKDVVNSYIEYPKEHWFTVKSIRQVGKSTLIQWLLTYASLKEAKSESLVVSPVFSQSRKIFTDLSSWAAPLLRKCNGATLQLEFINGSKVTFGSAEQRDSLRGFTVRRSGILCVDEAAYINENFFYEVLVPTTNVYKADIFVFSTPKFKQGLFYNLYIKGLTGDNPTLSSFDWTTYDTSIFLSPQILEVYRQQLPKLAFRAEFLGEFIEGEGSVFSDFKRCTGKALLDPNEELTIGIDWSSGQNQDFTVCSPGQFVNGKIQIDDLLYFNDKNANQTVGMIVNLVDSYVQKGFKQIHLIVEKNSIGAVFFDILSTKIDEYETQYNDLANWQNEIDIRVSTFNTSNASKQRIIKNMIVLFENNQIVIPNNEKLLNELSVFECKISQNGNPIYSAPPGLHDDTILSSAILVGQLYNEVEQ